MLQITIRIWSRIALFNLLLVAVLGFLMRLKILMPLPWLDQRFTLHAHSHFAFSGWISHALLFSISAAVLRRKFDEILPVHYGLLLAFNMFCAYGMLVSFFVQGYAAVSIAFSTLCIPVSFIFYRFCIKDVSEADRKEVWWKYIHAALIFNMLSYAGTFLLIWTMIVQPGNTWLRLSAVYFYLHFQYNGWFFFACAGLFHYWLKQQNVTLELARTHFWLFAFCCIPMYLLSINSVSFPVPLHVLAILTALIQYLAFVCFAYVLWQSRRSITAGLPLTVKYLLTAVFIALIIKFTLQTVSCIPAMAQLASGFRPVVIAYLHLVLLGIVSLLLIFWFCINQGLKLTSVTRTGIYVFVFGVILNEFILMIQGLGAIGGMYIGHVPEALALAALVMVTGMVVLLKNPL